MRPDLTVVLATPTQKRAWIHEAWKQWSESRGFTEERFHRDQDFQENEAGHTASGRILTW